MPNLFVRASFPDFSPETPPLEAPPQLPRARQNLEVGIPRLKPGNEKIELWIHMPGLAASFFSERFWPREPFAGLPIKK